MRYLSKQYRSEQSVGHLLNKARVEGRNPGLKGPHQ